MKNLIAFAFAIVLLFAIATVAQTRGPDIYSEQNLTSIEKTNAAQYQPTGNSIVSPAIREEVILAPSLQAVSVRHERRFDFKADSYESRTLEVEKPPNECYFIGFANTRAREKV